MSKSWQHEDHVPEPPQPKLQDPEATENSDPATRDDDEKRKPRKAGGR